ncbi:MAG: UDP-N-acetylmuramoyl-L-alanyl-D-glutamate--2,6-diaminopimelate ligase [Candidatus Moraniibacteriota bacterium]
MKKLIPQSIKNIYHLFQAVLANVWYGFPSRKLKMIGVTGTNGKTTTVQMIAKILEEENFKVAVASTINFKLAEKEWVNKSKFTTLSSFALQKFLAQAVSSGCEYAVLEVSSHSLNQNRVWGVDFDVAVITSVTREHLDYHETIGEYSKAKEKLFAMLGRFGRSVAVVNLGMEFADDFLKYPADEKYGFCIKHQAESTKYPDVKIIEAEDIELDAQNTRYKILDTKYQINLPGEFNVENVLAATCVGLSQGISLEKISEALAKIKGVPGRMERIENDRGIEIIVDYAVTPDSLEKLYGFFGEIRERRGDKGKIVAVFGSCGERDRGKRPIMGEIVSKHADYCIVTNEDPYHEDPLQIIDEVFAGVKKHKKENENAWRILDRREAIKTALQIAKPGDVVVVTGKGAEETMAIGDKMIPWNDPKVIREILAEL